MFEAVKQINRLKPQQKLLIKTKNGVTSNESEQVKIIANYFKEIFNKNVDAMPNIKPTKMKKPFTTNEIKKVVKTLNNNKSPGKDEISVELIKAAPNIIFQKIANIYNKIAETGEYPNELTHGLLKPLQKPGKQKGPLSNLRPITLLSILRKILAACLMKRIGD